MNSKLIYDSKQGGWLINPPPDITWRAALKRFQNSVLAGNAPEFAFTFSTSPVAGQTIETKDVEEFIKWFVPAAK